MRLWFAPNSEVPIYRQLVTQVVLAILCGDLQPGARLPSVRDLARRYGLHPNTISTGYRQLEKEGWTEHRHGSGVFVCTKKSALTPEQQIDFHISGFFRTARDSNMSGEMVRSRVAEWLTFPPPDHFLLVDPDPKMRKILLTELSALTKFPVTGVDLEKQPGRRTILRVRGDLVLERRDVVVVERVRRQRIIGRVEKRDTYAAILYGCAPVG